MKCSTNLLQVAMLVACTNERLELLVIIDLTNRYTRQPSSYTYKPTARQCKKRSVNLPAYHSLRRSFCIGRRSRRWGSANTHT